MVREGEPTERSQRDAVDDTRPFIAYLAGTQESEAVAGFQEALRRHRSERGDELMTYAEELLAQGRVEGLREGGSRGGLVAGRGDLGDD